MPKNDPRWDRLKDLFAAAQAVPESERESFLRERGAGADTVHEVLELLGAHVATEEQPGDAIGTYKLLENLGEGGFGTVWMAEQRAPVQRRVALKVLKAGMDSAQILARFEQERQALALMQHPNIAQVYDAGTTPRGRPFFVMELVRGIPITHYASRERLTIKQRLELFVQVCRAVQHAHHKGVVHRDIKPRNVLVGTADGRPLAKVIDFGIAKATTGRLTERTLFTEHRAMVGTLEYMSPEQAEGLLDVDTRADVYSLGALLYELLTGSTPFLGAKLLEAGFGEMLRTLREVEPERPSVRVSSKMGAGWAASGVVGVRDPKELFGSLRGDLDWVVMKALEKDRGRRYGTAEGLAADVECYLRGEAVTAVPPSVGYRVRKFVRRNRGGVFGGAAVVITLVTGILSIHWALQKAAGEEANARQLDAKLTASVRSEAILKYSERLSAAKQHVDSMRPELALQALDACERAMRGWEWHHLRTLSEECVRPLGTSCIAFALRADGQELASLGADGAVSILKMASGSVERRFPVVDPANLQGKSYELRFPAPDRLLVRQDLEFLLVDPITGQTERGLADATLPPKSKFVALSEDCTKVATSQEREYRVWDLATGATVMEVDHTPEVGGSLSADGRFLVLTSRWVARVWQIAMQAAPLEVTGRLTLNPFGPLSCSDQGDVLDLNRFTMVAHLRWPAGSVAGYVDATHLWFTPEEQPSEIRRLPEGDTVWRPDKATIVDKSGCWICGIQSHDLRRNYAFSEWEACSLITGEPLPHQEFEDWQETTLTPDGGMWVGIGDRARLMATSTRPPLFTAGGDGPVLTLATIAGTDGPRAIARTATHWISLDESTAVRLTTKDHFGALTKCAGSANGTRLVHGRDSDLIVTNSSGEVVQRLAGAAVGLRAIAMDRAGTLVCSHDGKAIRVWNTGSAEFVFEVSAPKPGDGARVATAVQSDWLAWSMDRTIYTRQFVGMQAQVAGTLDSPAVALAFAPDAARLLVGMSSGEALVLHSMTLLPIARLQGDSTAVRAVAWSADGERVFTASASGIVRVWFPQPPELGGDAMELLSLQEPAMDGRPTALLVTPDGERIVCGYDDGSIRVWDSVPWRERAKHVTPLFPSSPK